MPALRRREFTTLLGGAATWPLAARAQQGERMLRIGLLIQFAESDPNGQARVAAFREGFWPPRHRGKRRRITGNGGGNPARKQR